MGRHRTCMLAACLAVVLSVGVGCDESAKKPAPAHATAPSAHGATPVASSQSFTLPSSDGVSLAQVNRLLDKALFSYGKARRPEVAAWVERAIHMPVTSERQSAKAVKPAGELRCHLGKELSCAFKGTVSGKIKYFVASASACIDAKGHEVMRADWKVPADIKRDVVRELPVKTAFLKSCWEKGGVKLNLDLVGSKCHVRFPRQVRCAGEYDTCRQTCKEKSSCLAKCDWNRRDCLNVCGHR